jgi:glucose-6-phosphate 1-dehydrogenase
MSAFLLMAFNEFGGGKENMANHKPDDCLLVIFGASGDLVKRKLIPALFALFQQKLLPEHFAILGAARTQMTDADFRAEMADAVRDFSEHKPRDDAEMEAFTRLLHYHPLRDYVEAWRRDEVSEFAHLKAQIEAIAASEGLGANYIFYLATPAKVFGDVAEGLGAHGLQNQDHGWRRIIVEKPFGEDLDSARKLNQRLLAIFEEDQIYRIDHYLGKETVQNLLVFRFANGIFEPVWNRQYIDHVEVTAAETIGVEERGAFYEGTGALRDMVQSHLLQIAAMVAMEQPESFEAQTVRNQSLEVFQHLRHYGPDEIAASVVRGQYMASKIRGQDVKGYREEDKVGPDSRTDTYVALRVFIDNERWGGVPFYIRAGKRLPTRATEAVIYFKPGAQHLFGIDNPLRAKSDTLILRIQPDEGIVLKFQMKAPGPGFDLQDVQMDFHYSDLTDVHLPSAYERLVVDAMLGSPMLYARGDVIESCWEFITPILDAWRDDPKIGLYGYPAGTWGPPEADDLLARDGATWRYPCKNLAERGGTCVL